MRVTVLIPLYNQASFILSAVASVQAQAHTDWDLIIVDDGSTDGGAEKLTALTDARIRVVRQHNAGVSAARNRGLSEAKTPWVAFLDADDTWTPSHLSDLLALHAHCPDAVLLGTGFWYVNQQGRRLRRSASVSGKVEASEWAVLDDYCDIAQRQGLMFVTSSVMVNREVALSLGGFRHGVVAGEDLLMWATLASTGPVACTGACSTHYLEPSMEATSRERVIRRPQLPDVVAQALMSLQQQPEALPGIRRFRAGWYRMRAVLWLELNERRRCLLELSRAITCDGFTWKDLWCLGALCVPQGWRARMLALKRGAL